MTSARPARTMWAIVRKEGRQATVLLLLDDRREAEEIAEALRKHRQWVDVVLYEPMPRSAEDESGATETS